MIKLPLIAAIVAALVLGGGQAAATATPRAMPPTCTELGRELAFTFLLGIHRRAPNSADVIHGQVTTDVGPYPGGGQDACAPTAFHLRLALQYHKIAGWKTVANGSKDEGTLPVGTLVFIHIDRDCEAPWNGHRDWRLRLRWWGRNGLGQFQRGRTIFYPNSNPGRELRCFSP